eukprot:TRINITY_DN1039_c12_g1_i1.p1 TRINITY_DN1039_c12_g1~~TRINITY_DN1039_c12_g1_i1.p1  ORF type:complete len:517 (+),score=84.82 TRINITY_DN1039_c12_g1_i1:63-1553(+)
MGLKKGDQVEVFYRFEHDGSGDGGNSYFPVLTNDAGLLNPRLGQTDSWQRACVLEDFDESKFNEAQRDTWVQVEMSHRMWSNRKGKPLDLSDPVNTHVKFVPQDVRPVSSGKPSPRVSFFVMRWGGPYEIPEHSEDGEFGGWGDIGTCICDKYINTFFRVVYESIGPNYEVFSCFVSQSRDLEKLYPPAISALLSGQRKVGMYFLWPVGWLDCNEGQTGYVEKDSFFQCLRLFEASGISTKHPHPSNLYHLFASKSWTSTMCLAPGFNVPATTKINRSGVLGDLLSSAATSLRALAQIQSMKYNTPLDSINIDEISGVAKLGFSWEAQDVLRFKGVHELAQRLEHLLEQAGCTTDSIYVQEEIPNDCEIRVYLIDGKPATHLYSRFCEVDEESGSYSAFKRIDSRDVVIREWFNGNDAGLRDAERQIEELTNRWLTWMLAEHPVRPPVCRMDFFVKLHGATATVTTGELTEQGASMLGWKEGPRLTFDAILRECLN